MMHFPQLLQNELEYLRIYTNLGSLFEGCYCYMDEFLIKNLIRGMKLK